MTWDARLASATAAWRELCRALEATGVEALTKTMTHDEIDLAEGLRHLTRMTNLALVSSMENQSSALPYLWTALDPHRKMGGDNPQGLYLTAPINGTDTFRLRGNIGSARWVSIIVAQAGLPPFGEALFLPDLTVAENGDFDVVIAPEPHPENWLKTTASSTGLLIRQFFGSPDNVVPMTLDVVNLSVDADVPPSFTLQPALDGLARAQLVFSALVPMMQGEMLARGHALNSFETDIDAPTSGAGGVPGGNAVIARWRLAPDEALIVRVTPPTPCAYWDVQVGNGWYESFDYRHHFTGFTCEDAHLGPRGDLTFVISQQDPGTVNWLETADHSEGHVAIRWQLSEGNLPIPDTRVVSVADAADLSGLPRVDAAQRATRRALLASSFDRRFGFSGGPPC